MNVSATITSPIHLATGEEISTVPRNELPMALDVLEKAFPDMPRSFFYSIICRDPWYRPHFSLAVKDGKQFLSFLQIFDRSIQFNHTLIRFGGIGSVGTRPECRGRGYASALLRYAITRMEQEGWWVRFSIPKFNPSMNASGGKSCTQVNKKLQWIHCTR